jgi:hypothetical protein
VKSEEARRAVGINERRRLGPLDVTAGKDVTVGKRVTMEKCEGGEGSESASESESEDEEGRRGKESVAVMKSVLGSEERGGNKSVSGLMKEDVSVPST